MTIRRPILYRVFASAPLALCLAACNVGQHRPAGVPASATYADHNFIECSLVKESDANRCTVYKDDTGEILAEGIFILAGTQRAADESELGYAGFSNRAISLKNGGSLVLRYAFDVTERDPTNRVIRNRLKLLSGGEAVNATDCGKVLLPEQLKAGNNPAPECALRALAAKEPFYVRLFRQRRDSIRFQGFTGDRNGNLYEADYDSQGWKEVALPKETEVVDDGLTVVMACPKPATLTKTHDGWLTCDRPTAAQVAPVRDRRKSSPILSIDELLANGRTYAHTLVTARGCYLRGFELSVLRDCSMKDQAVQHDKSIWVETTPRGGRELVFHYQEAEALHARTNLRNGEVVLLGQFETTDWRDDPLDGGFGHLSSYHHELILAAVLGN